MYDIVRYKTNLGVTGSFRAKEGNTQLSVPYGTVYVDFTVELEKSIDPLKTRAWASNTRNDYGDIVIPNALFDGYNLSGTYSLRLYPVYGTPQNVAFTTHTIAAGDITKSTVVLSVETEFDLSLSMADEIVAIDETITFDSVGGDFVGAATQFNIAELNADSGRIINLSSADFLSDNISADVGDICNLTACNITTDTINVSVNAVFEYATIRNGTGVFTSLEADNFSVEDITSTTLNADSISAGSIQVDDNILIDNGCITISDAYNYSCNDAAISYNTDTSKKIYYDEGADEWKIEPGLYGYVTDQELIDTFPRDKDCGIITWSDKQNRYKLDNIAVKALFVEDSDQLKVAKKSAPPSFYHKKSTSKKASFWRNETEQFVNIGNSKNSDWYNYDRVLDTLNLQQTNEFHGVTIRENWEDYYFEVKLSSDDATDGAIGVILSKNTYLDPATDELKEDTLSLLIRPIATSDTGYGVLSDVNLVYNYGQDNEIILQDPRFINLPLGSSLPSDYFGKIGGGSQNWSSQGYIRLNVTKTIVKNKYGDVKGGYIVIKSSEWNSDTIREGNRYQIYIDLNNTSDYGNSRYFAMDQFLTPSGFGFVAGPQQSAIFSDIVTKDMSNGARQIFELGRDVVWHYIDENELGELNAPIDWDLYDLNNFEEGYYPGKIEDETYNNYFCTNRLLFNDEQKLVYYIQDRNSVTTPLSLLNLSTLNNPTDYVKVDIRGSGFYKTIEALQAIHPGFSGTADDLTEYERKLLGGTSYLALNNEMLYGENTNIWQGRGLAFTIINFDDPNEIYEPTISVVSTTTYDTWDNNGETPANELATAITNMTPGQIGVITSFDAWEQNISSNLRTVAKAHGLMRIANVPSIVDVNSWRTPYAAIFQKTDDDGAKSFEAGSGRGVGASDALITAFITGRSFIAMGDQAITSLTSYDNEHIAYIDSADKLHADRGAKIHNGLWADYADVATNLTVGIDGFIENNLQVRKRINVGCGTKESNGVHFCAGDSDGSGNLVTPLSAGMWAKKFPAGTLPSSVDDGYRTFIIGGSRTADYDWATTEIGEDGIEIQFEVVKRLSTAGDELDRYYALREETIDALFDDGAITQDQYDALLLVWNAYNSYAGRPPEPTGFAHWYTHARHCTVEADFFDPASSTETDCLQNLDSNFQLAVDQNEAELLPYRPYQFEWMGLDLNSELTGLQVYADFIDLELNSIDNLTVAGQKLATKDDVTHLERGRWIKNLEEMPYELGAVIDQQTIFDTWYRFSHNTSGTYPARIGETQSWTQALNGDITCTINSGTYIGFVSPTTAGTEPIRVGCQISSTNADNDAIGLVIGFYIDKEGKQHTLSALRTGGGISSGWGTGWTSDTWMIIYNANQSDAETIASYPASHGGGWSSHSGYWIEFEKTPDGQVVAKTSDAGDTTEAGINNTYTLTIDLTSDDRLKQFMGTIPYGYACFSQNQSKFSNIIVEDGIGNIVDLSTGFQYVQDESELNRYRSVSNDPLDLAPTFYYNVNKKRLFYKAPEEEYGVINEIETPAPFIYDEFNHPVITESLIPLEDEKYDLGAEDKRWRNLYLSSNRIDMNGAAVQGDSSYGFGFGITAEKSFIVTGTDVDPTTGENFNTTSWDDGIYTMDSTTCDGTGFFILVNGFGEVGAGMSYRKSDNTLNFNRDLSAPNFTSLGGMYVDGLLDISGETFLHDAVYIDSSVQIDGALTVAGHTSLSTLGVSGQLTAASLNVTDLTSNRIVLAGANGELEDDGNLRFDGLTLDVNADVDITGDLNVDNNAVILGNLTVSGTTTYLNTTNTQVSDNVIVLNYGESGAGVTLITSGIEIDRGTDLNKSLLWNDNIDKWTFGSEVVVAERFEGNLIADSAYIGQLNASQADIDSAYIDKANVKDLDVDSGFFNQINVNNLDIDSAYIDQANIRDLDVDSAYIDQLNASQVDIDSAYIDQLDVDSGFFNQINVRDLDVDSAFINQLNVNDVNIDSGYADQLNVSQLDIDSAYINNANIHILDVDSAHIDNAVIDSAYIGQANISQADIDSAYIDQLNVSQLDADSGFFNQIHVQDAIIDSAHIKQLDIRDLNVDSAFIDLLHVRDLDIDSGFFDQINLRDLDVDSAYIDQLNVSRVDIDSAYIDQANINNSVITNLVVDSAHINTLSNNDLTTNNLLADSAEIGILTGTTAQFDTSVTTALVDTTNLVADSASILGDIKITGSFIDITTDELTEGGINLYYTDSRARNALNVTDVGGDGSLTYNNTTGEFVYTGPSSAEVRAHFSASGDLSYDSSIGQFSVTTYKTADFESDFSNQSTDSLQEGISNLYFTNARARSAITISDVGGDGSLSYNNITGLITYTGPSAVEVRAHFSASGDLSYDSSIGQFSITTYKTADFEADFDNQSTDSLQEGSNNLYYTLARFESDFSNQSTDSLQEGSNNLYYTDARVTALVDSSYVQDRQSYDASTIYIREAFNGDSNADFHIPYIRVTGTSGASGQYELGADLDGSGFRYNPFDNELILQKLRVDNTSTFDNTITCKHIIPSSNELYDLGSTTQRFRDLYLSGNTIDLNGVELKNEGGKFNAGGITLDSNFVQTIVDSSINELVDGAPTALNTLNELAAALNDDSDAYNTLNNLISLRLTEAQVTSLVNNSYVQARQDFAYSSLTGTPTSLNDFTNDSGFLNTSDVTLLVDSAYVQARQADIYRDSGFVTNIVDSNYVLQKIQSAVDAQSIDKFRFVSDSDQTIFNGLDDNGVTLSIQDVNSTVYVNGLLFTDSADYTVDSTNQITFTQGLQLDDEVIIVNHNNISMNVDGAYTPAVPSNWNTQPTTIAEALDMLAAAFAAQHGAV